MARIRKQKIRKMKNLDILEGVAHHGDEHIDEDDDDDNVVDAEQIHAHCLHQRGAALSQSVGLVGVDCTQP